MAKNSMIRDVSRASDSHVSSSLVSHDIPRDPEVCPLCDCMDWISGAEVDPSNPRPSLTDKYRMFHEPCICDESLQKDDPDSSGLCAFCDHLRLRHLMFCPRMHLNEAHIELPSISILRSRKGCKLCPFIAHAVTVQALFLGISESDILDLWIHLKPRRRTQDETIGIESISRIGRLHADFIFPDADDERGWDSSLGENNAELDVRLLDLHPWSEVSFLEPLVTLDVLGDLICWQTVRGWLNNPQALQTSNDATSLSLPSGFHVVDIKRRSVVLAPQKCKYAALSYVWGAHPDLSKALATKDTIVALGQDGALSDSQLPATVVDAMAICLELGMDYLWVDRLCIVQDDLVSKMAQINAMNTIYASSVLVIVQAAGADMESPLPGVKKPRTRQQTRIDVIGLQITNILPKTRNFSFRSAWSSRMWTYQETVLAKRKLVITDAEVILETDTQVDWEDRHGENQVIKSHNHYLGNTTLHTGTAFDDFARHLENYTSRNLSYQSDIYNAFQGITSSLYAESPGLKHGLPRQDFDQALLWGRCEWRTPGPAPQVRTISGTTLPSWSWSSMIGTTGFGRSPGFLGTLIHWHELDHSGQSFNLKSIETNGEPFFWSRGWGDRDMLHSPQLFLFLAWKHGCLETEMDLRLGNSKDLSFIAIDQVLAIRWPTYVSFLSEIVMPTYPKDEDFDKLDVALQERLIACQAQIALFQIELAREGVYRIVGPDGGVGLLNCDEPQAEYVRARINDPSHIYEFMGISISADQNWSVLDIDNAFQTAYDDLYAAGGDDCYGDVLQRKDFDITFFDDSGERLDPPSLINVMLIQRENYYYTRVSTGSILLTKWAKVERESKAILLL